MSDSQRIKIGILGGSFNPIHNGHIEIGLQAMKQYKLERIVVMPNNIPNYKRVSGDVHNTYREDMVKLAVKDIEGFVYSDMEITRPGITYTSDTLEELTRRYKGVSWHFIMGGDSLMNFDKWHRPDIIVSLSTLLVTARDDVDEEKAMNKIKELSLLYPGVNIKYVKIPQMDISSSLIRRKLMAGENIKGMVPDAVGQYIFDNHLYTHVGEIDV